MKALTKYNRVAGYLDGLFNLLNEQYFESALSKPVITVQSTPRAFGHMTVNECWTVGENGARELNIGAGTLARPIENVVATLLHEMVHIHNADKGIKDTSRGNVYHNKKFRDEAVKRGLDIQHDDKYGWTVTQPTEELLELCIAWDLADIKINRIEGLRFLLGGGSKGKDGSTDGGEPPKAKSSTRKYACPCCGVSVRATKTVNIICGDCNEAMTEVTK
jgi:hypothetical protein